MRTENEYHEERDQDLWHTYLRVCNSEQTPTDRDAIRQTVLSSARRFYVSEDRAARVVSQMARDPSAVERMLPLRRAMFIEIFRRTQALRMQHPNDSLIDLVREVVRRPAPQYYLTPQSGYMILRQIRRRRRQQRMAELQRHLRCVL